MKPKYDPWMMKYEVKGLGHFDTMAEAEKAISENGNSASLLLNITQELKTKLKELALKRNTTVTAVIREAIEKEVKNG